MIGATKWVFPIAMLVIGFGYGFLFGKNQARVDALDAAVRAECGKDVPVTAIWHQDYDQVIYHFRPTPDKWKDRWCKGRE